MSGARLRTVTLVAASVLSLACAPPNAQHAPESAALGTGAVVPLLLRGRVLADRVELDPVFRLPAATRATAPGGPHRVYGYDARGGSLFDVAFEAVPVADLPGAAEAHYSAVVVLDSAATARLHRVEVRTGDGLTTTRTASLSAEQLAAALAAADAVSATRLSDGRVRVSWDGGRFPMAMLSDADTGSIIAFARGGEIVLPAAPAELVVMLSEGVQSRARRVTVR